MVVSLPLMPANYDNSAWFYDRLSRLVYGDALVNAQVYLLGFIPADAAVLIVGGGSGWILGEIAKIYPAGLRITYAEVSSKMMAQAKKRHAGGNSIVFVNDAVENITLEPAFDAVLTAFVFDSFSEQTMKSVFGHIHSVLKPGGVWLYSDFRLTKKWWQRAMLKTMLRFFRLVCHIEASKLPDVDHQFEMHQYTIVEDRAFFNDFIISTVYIR